MGKWCLHASSFIFDRIIIKVAGNQDRHKSLDEFDFGPLVSMAHLYVFEMRFDLGTLDSGERSLPFGLLVHRYDTSRSSEVDRSILCSKLKLVGVGSTKWFESYLSNRSQLVNVGKINSDVANVTCGVPQGSILGPLLSLCYVNDMVISIDPDCKRLLHADDSIILFLTKIQIKLQINSDEFSNPAQNGLLIINCLFIWENRMYTVWIKKET